MNERTDSIWERWVGGQSPAEFLACARRDIAAGKCASLRDAVRNYVTFARQQFGVCDRRELAAVEKALFDLLAELDGAE